MGTAWGRVEYEHAEINILFLKPCGQLRTFPTMAWTHLLTGFLKPYVPFLYPWHSSQPECWAAIVANLNQFPMRLPSGPSQGGDQAPSSTLPGGLLPTWALSSLAALQYLPKRRNPALRGWILPEGWGAFAPLGDSSYKALWWPQMRPVSSKRGVCQPTHQML